MADQFQSRGVGLSDPAFNAAEIVPDNATDLANYARGLWVGTAGDVKVDTAGGNTVTFVAAAAGAIIPVRTKRVYATGTTASNIVAMY